MRLWHKDLLPFIPRAQLVSQYRECCCIARSIALNGTPNHILVNRIMDYPLVHFIAYTNLVIDEMKARGYNCDSEKFLCWADCWYFGDYNAIPSKNEIFHNWHNVRYLVQNYYNLEEKHDAGGISDDEWDKFDSSFVKYYYNKMAEECAIE